MFRTTIQKISLWILKKTKYKFRIKYDDFEIKVFPVGIDTSQPTAYDFYCDHKGIKFMGRINMTRYFKMDEVFECSNPKTNGVKFNDEYMVKNLKQQYENLINSIKKSGTVQNS